MAWDVSGTKRQEQIGAGHPDLGNKPIDSTEARQQNLDVARMFGGPAVEPARVAYRAGTEMTTEARLPSLLIAAAPPWVNPRRELKTAGGLFAPGGEGYELSKKKANAFPSFDDNDEARLKAAWLFLQKQKGADKKPENIEGFNLAVQNNLDPTMLTADQKLRLAMRTVQVIAERKQFGGFSRSEELDEKEEYNDAWDVMTERLKWSKNLDAKGNPIGGALKESTADADLRKQMDDATFARLEHLTSNLQLNLSVNDVRRFIHLHLGDAVLLEKRGGDAKVFEPKGDPAKLKQAEELVRNGKAITRDDAINRIILDNPLEHGAKIDDHYKHYYAVVTGRE